jgi:hypothetical protein
MNYKIGDRVTLIRIPDGIESLPEETRKAFAICLNRSYQIIEIDNNGLLVLDVSKDVDSVVGGKYNDLRIESECVKRA